MPTLQQHPRILVLNERDPLHPKAGGAEIHVARIFSRLAARGLSITQYSAGFGGGAAFERVDGIEVERNGPLLSYYASMPGRLRRAKRKGEFDLVVECLNKVPFYSPVYAGIPVLALCHHLFGEVAFDQVAWPVAAAVVTSELGLARAYRDCPFLAISESTRDDLVARGIDPKRVVVSTPGIDRPTRDAKLDASRPVRATYLGRLEPYKRVDLMLKAGASLAGRFPTLELAIVGRGSDRARLEAIAKHLGIGERTRFLGFVTDAERDALLAQSRLCVFPSKKEGFGLTVIEANALGTPVVASDAPGLRDSIRHQKTGLLVAHSTPEAFADAMSKLLEEDESTLAMRRAAHAWSLEFDWDRAADDMQAAIERALATSPQDRVPT